MTSPKNVGPFNEAQNSQSQKTGKGGVNQNFNRYIRQNYNKSTSITGNNLQQTHAQIQKTLSRNSNQFSNVLSQKNGNHNQTQHKMGNGVDSLQVVNQQSSITNQPPPTAGPTTGGRRNRVISAYGYKNN